MSLYGGLTVAGNGVLIIYPAGDEQGWVLCPWCKQTKIMTDGLADVNVSTLCGFCKNYYSVNLKTLEATKTKAARRKAKNSQSKK